MGTRCSPILTFTSVIGHTFPCRVAASSWQPHERFQSGKPRPLQGVAEIAPSLPVLAEEVEDGRDRRHRFLLRPESRGSVCRGRVSSSRPNRSAASRIARSCGVASRPPTTWRRTQQGARPPTAASSRPFSAPCRRLRSWVVKHPVRQVHRILPHVKNAAVHPRRGSQGTDTRIQRDPDRPGNIRDDPPLRLVSVLHNCERGIGRKTAPARRTSPPWPPPSYSHNTEGSVLRQEAPVHGASPLFVGLVAGDEGDGRGHLAMRQRDGRRRRAPHRGG